MNVINQISRLIKKKENWTLQKDELTIHLFRKKNLGQNQSIMSYYSIFPEMGLFSITDKYREINTEPVLMQNPVQVEERELISYLKNIMSLHDIFENTYIIYSIFHDGNRPVAYTNEGLTQIRMNNGFLVKNNEIARQFNQDGIRAYLEAQFAEMQ